MIKFIEEHLGIWMYLDRHFEISLENSRFLKHLHHFEVICTE